MSLANLELQRSSTAEQAADVVRGKILRGEFLPGMPLREVALAASIGISRNTMREAIRLLAREGLVEHALHRGALVTRLRPEDVTDIFLVRRTVELGAVRASANASPAQLAALEETVRDFERAADADSLEELIESDMRFHERLVALLESERIERFFRTIQSELRLCLSIIDRHHDHRPLVAEHRELYELMASGRQVECEEHLRRHLADAEALAKEILCSANHGEPTG
jgi:DNA-binding GntR family transcriptional regulator